MFVNDTIMIMNYGFYFNEDSRHGKSSLCTEFNHMIYRLCRHSFQFILANVLRAHDICTIALEVSKHNPYLIMS